MRDRPQDMGLAPYGETKVAPPSRAGARRTGERGGRRAARGTALARLSALAGSFFIWRVLDQTAVIGTHLIPACIDAGIPEVAGASMLASMAIFNFIAPPARCWLSAASTPGLLLSVYYRLRWIVAGHPAVLLRLVSTACRWFVRLLRARLVCDRAADGAHHHPLFGRDRSADHVRWLTLRAPDRRAAAAFLAGLLRMELGTYLQASSCRA